jgi:hypothetical protein
VTLTEYLDRVDAFWDGASEVCQRCYFYDEGNCALLHDRVVPHGDCLGLLERDGIKQPA